MTGRLSSPPCYAEEIAPDYFDPLGVDPEQQGAHGAVEAGGHAAQTNADRFARYRGAMWRSA